MPIYEYECENCHHIEEAWQKISDAPLATCNQCQGKLHKIVSQSSFHLKGSGWYVTDYSRKPSNKTDNKTDTKADTKKEDSASSESTKETKTAAKTSSD